MTWLLCDFGNVLANPPTKADLSTALELAGITESRFWETYWATRLPYDPDITLLSYWTEVSKHPENVKALVELDLAAWMRPKLDVVEAVSRAKARGFRLALFSNAPKEFEPAFQEREWLSEFEHLLVSSEMGAKPSADAYRNVCSRLISDPNEIVFIDDRPENIEGAIAVGINAILFTHAGQVDELELTMFVQ